MSKEMNAGFERIKVDGMRFNTNIDANSGMSMQK